MAVVGWYVGRRSARGEVSTTYDRQTVIVVDTIRYNSPEVVKDTIVRYVEVALPIVARMEATDSVVVAETVVMEADSARVTIPIAQCEYRDSTYRAWVSGYMAQLDSIEVYAKTTTVTKMNRSRWGLGVTGGVGCTSKGLGAYIGIGITYSIIQF
jgi:hypothetical protein